MYFLIYALFLPVMQLAIFCEASLIASGNAKVSRITSIAMCVLDVVFNYLFIFVLGLGVKGAALGTGLATLCAGGFLLWYATCRCPELRQAGSWVRPARRILGGIRSQKAGALDAEQKDIFKRAFGISWPLWLQNLVTRGAYIAATVLVAPLGTVAIAANSFGIIAEGFCYLPGYGMQDAATTLVWAFAPQIMGLLSPDPEVIALGAECLRIQAWAELLFGVSIVAYGCCVGAGDTLVPSAINLLSMWVIRLGIALLLIPRFGLEGYWIAMATELCVKGLVFAVRIGRGRWMKTLLTVPGT